MAVGCGLWAVGCGLWAVARVPGFYCVLTRLPLACVLSLRFALLATDRGAARSILVFKYDEDKVWAAWTDFHPVARMKAAHAVIVYVTVVDHRVGLDKSPGGCRGQL